MTKIDTKKIRSQHKSCEDADVIDELCDAYDEAQKEIKTLEEITTNHCDRQGDFLVEAETRITTLEGLLRDVYREWHADDNKAMTPTIARIQKELGEG